MRRTAFILAAAAIVAAVLVAVAVSRGPSPKPADSTATPTTAPTDAEGGGSPGAGREPPVVRLEEVPGSYSQPLYVTAPSGDASRLFIVEKTGAIRIVKDGAPLDRPFLDISDEVSSGSEQGLLSMTFDPDYAASGLFYVDYTDRDGDTRVVRYRVSEDPDRADPSTAIEILRVEQPYSNHNGGQLQFGPDGRLYVGMGDGGSAGDPHGHAQDPESRLGKLLRIDVSATPPRVAIWATGLRNPWRFSFDRDTGALWIGDVGQGTREEIDYLPPGQEAGVNFGWNGYEGSEVYDQSVASQLDEDALTFPVGEYGRELGFSVTGGYVYRGSAVPGLRGFYLFGDFGSGGVWAMRGPGAEPHRLQGVDGEVDQLSSFGEGADGELYVTSLAGPVYRIVAP
ncbi:MAG: PQQ-dependent sugar dehydrogenase [Actinobacteria bacterium]|nr:PQQ-dependent sugar dehydrogenase [Actinomycetota bacterium]